MSPCQLRRVNNLCIGIWIHLKKGGGQIILRQWRMRAFLAFCSDTKAVSIRSTEYRAIHIPVMWHTSKRALHTVAMYTYTEYI